MHSFQSPVDIANRGCDHVGAGKIRTSLGFSEQSKRSLVMGRLYNPLRRAELQRNTWRFAIREAVLRAIDTTTMLLAPALWVETTTYFRGSIVCDEDGTPWISRVPDNLGNDPQNSSSWEQYFGPLAVPAWDTAGTTAYSAGELVYTAAGDGTNRVYLSRISANTDNPATATAWDSTVTYYKNEIVTRSSVAYMSRIDLNLNQDPATTFHAEWAIGTTYAINDQVTGSDGVVYTSTGNGNVGHDPTTDGGTHWTAGGLSAWDSTFVAGAGSVNWLQIGGAEFPMGVTLTKWAEPYPLDAGPSNQASTRNVFRLPAAFLKKAPQDPKAGSFSPLGAPTNAVYDDWLFEKVYIVTAEVGPIRLRFVADTVDVTIFDDMFCEMLAAKMGEEACEDLTQSSEKKAVCREAFKTAQKEAVINNAILIGSEEAALDDWIAARA